ncbi:MMPL family transporter [soil metagenome]
MFYRLGKFAAQRHRYVIAAWLLLFLCSAPLVPHLPSVLKVGGFSNPEIESARARQSLESSLDSFAPSVLIIIFESEALQATDPAFLASAEIALSRVLDHPDVSGITRFIDSPSQISSDGHTAYSLVQIDVPPEEAQRILPEIRELMIDTGLETTLAGAPAFFEDIERLSEQDLRRAELIAIPFALIALVLVFGTLFGAGVPLVVGAFSVATVLGMLFVVGQWVDLSIFVLNLTTMLGLGLAIDYSLFMTSRYREELPDREPGEAVAVTVDSAGRAVFYSGVSVMIGLSGLALFDIMFLRSVGVAGLFVVAISILGAMTLLPAVLSVVGHRINDLRILGRNRSQEEGMFWTRLSNVVMDHPWFVFVPTVGLLLVLGLPFLNANLSSPDASILPERVDSRKGFETLRSEFNEGEISPIIISVESAQPVTDPAELESLWDFTRWLASDERVMRIDSIVTLDRRLTLEQYGLLYRRPELLDDPFLTTSFDRLAAEHTTAILVYTRDPSNATSTRDLVGDIRAYDQPPGRTMLVNGGAAEIEDIISDMYSTFPIVAGLVILVTYLVLLVMLRSVILPLKAILMNALSIVASFGAMVFIFQEGHFDWLFRFDRLGYVEASQPIILFCILFGLSMDYEVFLLSRIREEYLRTGDNRRSVAAGLQRSGRIITGAALIVVLVTASFATAEIVLVKSLGLGIAIAIFLDATVVRALLVPATMRLLGDWNWWLPAPIARVFPRKELAH